MRRVKISRRPVGAFRIGERRYAVGKMEMFEEGDDIDAAALEDGAVPSMSIASSSRKGAMARSCSMTVRSLPGKKLALTR